jgi:D-alanyl-D-alanine carboxypeptidase
MSILSVPVRHRHAWQTTLVATALAGTLTGCASDDIEQQPHGAPLAAIRAELTTEVRELVATGPPGAILYVRDGDRVVEIAAGTRDLTTHEPMHGDEHFKIASLTKTYTAALVLQLVQEGMLQVSDNVEQWLPGVVPNGEHITVHMLLNHTSGLADFDSDPKYLKPYLSGDLGYYWSPRQLIDMAVAHDPLFPPGHTTHEAYSNTDYVLLGLIIEEITGKPLDVAMQQRLLEPLQLTDTTFPTEPGLPAPYAHGYMVIGSGGPADVSGLSPSMSPASGAIIATAADTADFYRALLRGNVVDQAELAAMKQTIWGGPHVDIPGQRYGYGLESFPTPCGTAWGHNGVIPGYMTYIYSSEDGDRQAVLMINHDPSTLPEAFETHFFGLIAHAYCSTAPSGATTERTTS